MIRRLLVLAAVAACPTAAADVRLERHADRVDVGVDGRPFTAYVFAGHSKPILHPVIGPGGAAMTRAWPMVEDVPGEPRDHPHHESIWFAHGDVNGVDFWAAHPRARAARHRVDNRIEHAGFGACEGGPVGRLETRNRWLRADGKVVCTDTRRLTFAADAGGCTVGVAILDHPGNLRHPSRWHARDYGLVAANPFGLHDFTGAPAGSGALTIPAGESRTFRYLVVLHEGETGAADIEGRWRRWADATRTAVP